MSALHNAAKIRSSMEVIARICRAWAASSSELKYCGEEGVERIAKDAGVSVSELRRLASEGPQSAELLLGRMAALDLDRNEVARIESQVFRDLQRVCTMCESHGRCARELMRDSADPAWKNYCPNAETLMELDALPWASRREW